MVRPLKTKTADEVTENLKDIYLDVGVPDIIQHDQGKEFTSNVSYDFVIIYIEANLGTNPLIR